MDAKYRIVIVEDHSIVREGLRAMLESEPTIDVVGEAADGHASLMLVEELEPDLVLMDLSMPKLNGIEAIREIKRINSVTDIVVLTVHKSEQNIMAAYEAGAKGYVLKEATRQELLDAIHYVLKGNTYICPAISKKVIEGYLGGMKQMKAASSLDKLTPREKQILKLIAEGYRSKDIAELLNISSNTVIKHRSNLMNKLDLHSVSDLVMYSIREGLVNQ